MPAFALRASFRPLSGIRVFRTSEYHFDFATFFNMFPSPVGD